MNTSKEIDISQGNDVVASTKKHMDLLELAIQNKSDISAIERLVDLQTTVEERHARKAFFNALSKFQSEVPPIKKEGEVKYKSTNYTYAKLEDIVKTIRPHLAANGLSFRYEQQAQDGVIKVICIITHELGHQERSEMKSCSDTSGGKDAIKAIASAVTYLRRYTLTGALGIVMSDEDDDAQYYSAYNFQEKSEPQGSIYYDDSEFNKNFPIWQQAIQSGKINHQGLIDKLSSKAVLTNNQVDSINGIQG
ncbi:MAG: hypothetical protein GY804_02790 [Alphaproteobacteria bacterium]|nr:hypothetical protein [Alphaproteobacteria bacterium]